MIDEIQLYRTISLAKDSHIVVLFTPFRGFLLGSKGKSSWLSSVSAERCYTPRAELNGIVYETWVLLKWDMIHGSIKQFQCARSLGARAGKRQRKRDRTLGRQDSVRIDN